MKKKHGAPNKAVQTDTPRDLEKPFWDLKDLSGYFLVIFFVSLTFFLVNIQFPKGHNFDEFHYVPAAKFFLNGEMNKNLEHPPLAKWFMAIGIGIFGDQPMGWRFMSTVFGSFTLVGIFVAALALFRKKSVAIWITLLTLFNQLLYVQARIGMLDTFMMAFLIWALAFYFELWHNPRPKVLAICGVFFGLAVACKWFALMAWLAGAAAFLLVKMFQNWGTEFKNPKESDWFQPNLFVTLELKDWVFKYFGLGILAYFITFVPYLYLKHDPAYGLWDLVKMQWEMYDAQLRVVNSHPYNSEWKTWALMKRPIWYAFDHEPGNIVRGVLLLGNPLIMWGGLVTLAACLYGWVKDRTKIPFLILLFYAAFYLTWAFIPRKIAFYYYYYPAGLVLSFSWAYVMERFFPETSSYKWVRWVVLGGAAALFIYFFPILAALKIEGESFRNWMWFQTWI